MVYSLYSAFISVYIYYICFLCVLFMGKISPILLIVVVLISSEFHFIIQNHNRFHVWWCGRNPHVGLLSKQSHANEMSGAICEDFLRIARVRSTEQSAFMCGGAGEARIKDYFAKNACLVYNVITVRSHQSAARLPYKTTQNSKYMILTTICGRSRPARRLKFREIQYPNSIFR